MDNAFSRDGSYSSQDIKRVQDDAETQYDFLYDLMVRVARGEIGVEFLGRAVITDRPEWRDRIPAHMHVPLSNEEIRRFVKEREARWPTPPEAEMDRF